MLDEVVAAAHAVAQSEILPRFLRVAAERKEDGSILTAADVAAQRALTERLQAIVPAPVLGEEMDEAAQQAIWTRSLASGESFWCIDPIDGTTNFANGLPYFAISIAWVEHGRATLGVVHKPCSGSTFYAVAGRGAFLDRQRLPLRTPNSSLDTAVAGVELRRLPRPLAIALASDPPYAAFRNLGASTLDLCYIAAGRFDIYAHGGMKLWDYAAASLIAREAGAVLSGLDGSDFDSGDAWSRPVLAAASPTLYADWLRWVGQYLA